MIKSTINHRIEKANAPFSEVTTQINKFFNMLHLRKLSVNSSVFVTLFAILCLTTYNNGFAYNSTSANERFEAFTLESMPSDSTAVLAKESALVNTDNKINPSKNKGKEGVSSAVPSSTVSVVNPTITFPSSQIYVAHGDTNAVINYSSTSGGSIEYRMEYSSSAVDAGFVTTDWAPLPPSPILAPLPSGWQYPSDIYAAYVSYRIVGDTSDGTTNEFAFITTKRSITGTVEIYDKTYDGTTTASAGLVLVNPSDQVNGDDIYIVISPGTYNFTDKNAGTDKEVTFSGTYSLQGADKDNYVLSTMNILPANITPKTLTVNATVSNKVYNKSTAASLSSSSLSGGIISGDSVSLNNPSSFTFSDDDVGN